MGDIYLYIMMKPLLVVDEALLTEFNFIYFFALCKNGLHFCKQFEIQYLICNINCMN